jgi:enoyl-CoA hydratase
VREHPAEAEPEAAMSNVVVARAGGIATVTINRPDKLNALDATTVRELHGAVEEVSADAAVGVAIVTGAGPKAFVAGADIAGLADQTVLGGQANAAAGQGLTLLIERSPKPFLAAINGFALGGGLELALACDMRFAAAGAKLGLPEVGLGIIPGYGGTQRLPRLVGMGPALELILTGDPIPAEEAFRIGLVNRVFPPERLMDEVTAIARKILSRGAHAVALAKQAARRGCSLGLEAGLALEADLFGVISSTDEMREGLRAFLEKRKPSWLRA